MALLEVENIHTFYGKIHALKGISLTVEEGEIVTLIGGNGAGKTTTLNTICGIVRAPEGRVMLARRRHHPSAAAPDRRARHRPVARRPEDFPAPDGDGKPGNGRLYAARSARASPRTWNSSFTPSRA